MEKLLAPHPNGMDARKLECASEGNLSVWIQARRGRAKDRRARLIPRQSV
jgi:hypothetical protein